MPNASRPRRLPRLRRLLALATDNWLARGYLTVTAVSVLVMFLFPESGPATSPLILTAPLSFMAMALPFGPGTGGGGVAEAAATGFSAVWLLLCAFVNAAVLGALVARSAAVAPSGPDEPGRRTTDTAPSARPGPQRIRALLTPAVDNWLARAYLAVVAASLGFFLCAAYVLPDPGFAGIWPLMTTGPLSLLALLVSVPAEHSSPTWLTPLVFTAGCALAGLFNAALLGRLAHRLRERAPHPAV
jgi:hypothetical protein